MQNNYIKALAVKTYQEELTREYVISKKRPFHPPSFTFWFYHCVVVDSVHLEFALNRGLLGKNVYISYCYYIELNYF